MLAVVVASILVPTTAMAATQPSSSPTVPHTASAIEHTKVVITPQQWNALHQRAEQQSQHAPNSTPTAPPVQPQSQHGTAAPQSPSQAEPAARSAAVANNQYVSMDADALAAQDQPNAVTPDAAAPIGNQPDPTKSAECLGKSQVDSDFGVVLDRFNYCDRRTAQFDFYVDYPFIGLVYQGSNRFTFEIYGQGDNTQRHARMFFRVVPGSVQYLNWDNPIDYFFTAPDIPLRLGVYCNDDNCGSSGGATLMFITWDNQQDWQYSDIGVGTVGATGRDQLAYSRVYLQGDIVDSDFQQVTPIRSQQRILRCDSASYFNKGTAKYPQACIFDEVIPFLTYRLSGTVPEVAQHIQQAQNNPNSTYPQTPGHNKVIPGQFIVGNSTVPGLHRLLNTDPQFAENALVKTGACYKTGPYGSVFQTTGLPVPPDTQNPDPTKRQDCDEYPFRSTREGAADSYWVNGTHRWDFSVKAVNASQNRSAGAALRNYYVDDRMLGYDAALPETSNDSFYVNIAP